MSEENNHLLSNITVKQQNYIYSILQQLIQMQDENNPESAVTRKMLLATLLLQLKKMCENQHELGGDSGRVTNRIVSQIQGYIADARPDGVYPARYRSRPRRNPLLLYLRHP